MTHGVGWGARNYHPGKHAGDNTDYGDGNLFVLEYLASGGKDRRPFSVQHYVDTHWRAQYVNWQQGQCRACRAWIDSMVRTVLSNLEQGVPLQQAGGVSNGQVVRFAGALGVWDAEADLVAVARSLTEFTNRNPEPIAASEFWARVVHRVLRGVEPRAAMVSAAEVMHNTFITAKVQQALTKVDEALDPSTALAQQEFADDLALTSMARLWDVGKSEPIRVGKASPTEGTLPGAVYFIAKYGNLKAAAQANAMVGGDSASRAIPIGMVLGAAEGSAGLPTHWLQAYKETAHVDALLARLPLAAAAVPPPAGAPRPEL